MPPDFRVYRGLDSAAGSFAPSAITIGNFDGVHRGHQQLFHRLIELARPLGAKPSVLTFDPHPACVVAPDRAPSILTPMPQRLEWIRLAGIEQVLIIPFDRQLSLLTPEQFVERVLVQTAGAKAVLIGENFRFGNRQAGDPALLARLGHTHGFTVDVVREVERFGAPVSSTRLRTLIREGNVHATSRLLGRPYALDGRVVSGHGIGSRQTVPTLNLDTPAEVIPATGVYVTRVRDLESQRDWPAVTNVGFRPTFGGNDALSIESFLLEGFAEPTPTRIRVDFLHRLRPERKFPDAAALKAQILRDAARAQTWWRRTRRWVLN